MPKQYGTPGPRFIYPDACTSRSLAACHPMAQLLFDRLLTQCDDQGRLEADADVARALCMPLIPKATARLVEEWLSELDQQSMLIRYQVNGRHLIQVTNWWSFQAGMRRAYPSRWPSPPDWAGDRPKGLDAADRPDLPPNAPDIPPTPPRPRAHAEAEPSRAEPNQSRAKPLVESLPSETDTATLACRFFPDGGEWLGNREYVAKWDDLDRLYSAEWVQAELQGAYTSMLNGGAKRVKPWDYQRLVGRRCAERARGEEVATQEANGRRRKAEKVDLDAKIAESTPEQRELMELQRRAIQLWQEEGREARLPTDLAELRVFVQEHEVPAL